MVTRQAVRTRMLAVALAAAPLMHPAPAGAASPFDGTWTVVFTCPGASDGTAGYTRTFLASVRDGVMHGETGVQGHAGYLALNGPIKAEGVTVLEGRGLTGSADYAVGRPSPATPYVFHLQARFAGPRGTGSRVEVRRCDTVFSRQ